MVTTVGIDLAASPADTAIAALRWEDDRAVLEAVEIPGTDDRVLTWMHHPDGAVGIDCPFGWPMRFVELVSRHGHAPIDVPELTPGWRRDFVLRETDRFVHTTYGLTPLSVAADRIAHVAIRLSALIAKLDPAVDARLDGFGALVEVYPAAALKVWGLPYRGYKREANREVRAALVQHLTEDRTWLDLGSYAPMLRSSDHVLDAVICALVARARYLGRTTAAVDSEAACAEGWIHVPTYALDDLDGRRI